jgi:hypothetical protein
MVSPPSLPKLRTCLRGSLDGSARRAGRETIIGDVIRRVEAPSFHLSSTRDSQPRIIAITQCGRLHRSVHSLQVGITFSGAVVRALLRVLWTLYGSTIADLKNNE